MTRGPKSSVLFGLAHIMHGAQATIRSTLMGLLLAILYVPGGSLITPMILHTAVDLTSGETGALAFADATGELKDVPRRRGGF